MRGPRASVEGPGCDALASRNRDASLQFLKPVEDEAHRTARIPVTLVRT